DAFRFGTMGAVQLLDLWGCEHRRCSNDRDHGGEEHDQFGETFQAIHRPMSLQRAEVPPDRCPTRPHPWDSSCQVTNRSLEPAHVGCCGEPTVKEFDCLIPAVSASVSRWPLRLPPPNGPIWPAKSKTSDIRPCSSQIISMISWHH